MISSPQYGDGSKPGCVGKNEGTVSAGARSGMSSAVDRCRAVVGDHQRVLRDRDAVDQPVRVDRGLPLVGSDLVVDVRRLVGPLPHGEHQVALGALRPGRRGRHLAGGDALAPVGVHRETAVAAEAVHDRAHLRAALPEPEAVVPGLDRRIEAVEMADVGGEPVAHLVTELAALLGDVDPRVLAAQGRRDAVAVGPGAGELVRRRGLEQGVPVVGGIDLRRFPRRAGRRRPQRQRLPRLGRHRLGVGQAVAADPDAVRGRRQIGHQEASVVAGDHDLAEARVEVIGFRR